MRWKLTNYLSLLHISYTKNSVIVLFEIAANMTTENPTLELNYKTALDNSRPGFLFKSTPGTLYMYIYLHACIFSSFYRGLYKN